jgi:hypothetical protein
MQNYVVTPEFKTQAAAILEAKKFTAVFPYMNLINRDGLHYTEEEMNSLVQFLGEFPYKEVSEFFAAIPKMAQPANAETASPMMETKTETELATETAE